MNTLIDGFSTIMNKEFAAYNGINTWLVMNHARPAYLPECNGPDARNDMNTYLLSSQFRNLLNNRAYVVAIRHEGNVNLLVVHAKPTRLIQQSIEKLNPLKKWKTQYEDDIARILGYDNTYDHKYDKKVMSIAIYANSHKIMGYWSKNKDAHSKKFAAKLCGRITDVMPANWKIRLELIDDIDP